MTATETRKYKVLGMSCEHCRSSVLEEVADIDGVEKVDVSLSSGALDVQGSGIDDERVAAAVVAAGYQLVKID